jgi:hypothetical protein
LAVILGSLYYVQVNDQHDQAKRLSEITTCQAEYNKAFTQQLLIRSQFFQAADDTRNALLGGIASLVLAPRPTDPKVQAKRDEAFHDLFTQYLKASDTVENSRKNTPLPQIPDCLG